MRANLLQGAGPVSVYQNISTTIHVVADWVRSVGAYRYRIDLVVTRDEPGRYSAVAVNLPGAGGCGATEDEAVADAKEGAAGCLETYLALGQPIPWVDTSDYYTLHGATRRVVMICP